MGVLGDMLLATDIAAREGGESVRPPYRIDVKGIDSIKLSTLWAILEGRTIDEKTGAEPFPTIFNGSDEGPWVFEVPSSLDEELSRLTSENIEDVAEQWAQTAELRLDRIRPSDAEEYLEEMRQLALQPRNRNERLFLWMSL